MLPLCGKRVKTLQSVQVNTAAISWENLLTLTAEAEIKKRHIESLFQKCAVMQCEMKQRLVKKVRKNSRHFFIQSEVKPQSIVTRFHTHVSRASCQLHVFSSSLDWFTLLCMPYVLHQNNYFSFWSYDTQLKTVLSFLTPRRVETLENIVITVKRNFLSIF